MIEKLQDSRAVLLGAVAIFAFGLTTSGYALGDGLRRSKMAEHRTVTVRGVSERNVTADLATWSVSFSHEGSELAPVQQSVDQQASAIRAFFERAGFRPRTSPTARCRSTANSRAIATASRSGRRSSPSAARSS